jgi:hypothetical protein
MSDMPSPSVEERKFDDYPVMIPRTSMNVFAHYDRGLRDDDADVAYVRMEERHWTDEEGLDYGDAVTKAVAECIEATKSNRVVALYINGFELTSARLRDVVQRLVHAKKDINLEHVAMVESRVCPVYDEQAASAILSLVANFPRLKSVILDTDNGIDSNAPSPINTFEGLIDALSVLYDTPDNTPMLRALHIRSIYTSSAVPDDAPLWVRVRELRKKMEARHRSTVTASILVIQRTDIGDNPWKVWSGGIEHHMLCEGYITCDEYDSRVSEPEPKVAE